MKTYEILADIVSNHNIQSPLHNHTGCNSVNVVNRSSGAPSPLATSGLNFVGGP